MAKKTETKDPKNKEQQDLFCLEYLKDFNGTQAAIRAKYSEKSARSIASELLTKPYIQKKIAELAKEKFSKVDAEVDKILKELWMIGLSDIADLIEWGEMADILDKEGNWVLDDEGNPKQYEKPMRIKSRKEIGSKSRVISELQETSVPFGIKRKVKLHDKMKALELLGKYFALFTEKHELSNPDGNLKPAVTIYLPNNGRDGDAGNDNT